MELWKDVKGYEGLYQVSNMGRVKSLERTYMRINGKPQTTKAKFKKNSLSRQGYLCVTLSKKSKQKMFNVHRLVAEAFIPNPEKKRCVNHIDGNKTNNSIENLEWVTHKENTQHAYDTGLMKGKPVDVYDKETNRLIKTLRNRVELAKWIESENITREDEKKLIFRNHVPKKQ